MRHEEQNIAQNASIYISLENIVNESENNAKKHTQGNLWFALMFYTASSRMS